MRPVSLYLADTVLHSCSQTQSCTALPKPPSPQQPAQPVLIPSTNMLTNPTGAPRQTGFQLVMPTRLLCLASTCIAPFACSLSTSLFCICIFFNFTQVRRSPAIPPASRPANRSNYSIPPPGALTKTSAPRQSNPGSALILSACGVPDLNPPPPCPRPSRGLLSLPLLLRHGPTLIRHLCHLITNRHIAHNLAASRLESPCLLCTTTTAARFSRTVPKSQIHNFRGEWPCRGNLQRVRSISNPKIRHLPSAGWAVQRLQFCPHYPACC